MKNHNSLGRRVNIDNIYNFNRLSMFDSFEGGESLTVGFDFKKEKIINKNKIKEIKDYFEFKLATVIRHKEEKNIPLNSTIGKKRSNIFGAAKYIITDKLSLDYNFSATKDLSIMEYNSLDALFNFKNFSTQIKFIEERGNLGDTNIIENISKYNFDSSNSIEFKTRKNKKIN
jgi:LPS-assembly protein